MDSPRHLIGQAAAERGVSANQAKRALYLEGLSGQERTVAYAAEALHVKPNTIKVLARRFMIDFADYRPYAGMEKKGQPRPKANRRISTCPLLIYRYSRHDRSRHPIPRASRLRSTDRSRTEPRAPQIRQTSQHRPIS